MNIKKDCVSINGKQNVRLKSGTISFKNYFKQIPVPFKIYADFECILKKVESDISECDSNNSHTIKYQDHVPCSFAYKVVCVDNKFSKKVKLYGDENVVCEFISAILNEYKYCRKVVKNISTKILLCLQKKMKDLNKVIFVGFVIDCLMLVMKK